MPTALTENIHTSFKLFGSCSVLMLRCKSLSLFEVSEQNKLINNYPTTSRDFCGQVGVRFPPKESLREKLHCCNPAVLFKKE